MLVLGKELKTAQQSMEFNKNNQNWNKEKNQHKREAQSALNILRP